MSGLDIIDLDSEPLHGSVLYDAPPLMWRGYIQSTVSVIVPARASAVLDAKFLAAKYLCQGADEVIIVTGKATCAEAKNCGAANATGEWLIFNDDDIYVPNVVDTIRNSDGDWGTCRYRTPPEWLDNAIYMTVRNSVLSVMKNDMLRLRPALASNLTVPGAFIFCRQSAFYGVGGFHPSHVAEDRQFVRDLYVKGYKYRFLPDHIGNVSRRFGGPGEVFITRKDERELLYRGRRVWLLLKSGHIIPVHV